MPIPAETVNQKKVKTTEIMASIGEALEQIKIAQELAKDESVLLTFPETTISEDLENSAKLLRDAQRKLRPFMPQETNPGLEDIFGSLGDILNPLTITK